MTGTGVDVGEIRKEGWVSKESAVIRTYRKRWMVLTPDRLYSFKREKQYSDPTEARATPPRPWVGSHGACRIPRWRCVEQNTGSSGQG